LGDLDAMRYHLEVRKASVAEALWLAVSGSQLALVRFLVAAGADCNAGGSEGGGPTLLHVALAVWVRGGFGDREGAAFGVIEELAAGGADLDATIWPPPPAIGSAEKPTALRQVSLPFLRRGDPPLAWAMEYHAAACSGRFCEEAVGPRLCELVRCLVSHGANCERLGRRQRQSLGQLLRGGRGCGARLPAPGQAP